MRRLTATFPRCLVAAGLVGATLPLTVGSPGTAARAAAQSVVAPKFGYSTSAWAAPMQIEIYEPTIPIPASPQAELEVGYTEVVADSASSRGRASYLWPGAPIGEGFKTIAEAFGLPEQLAEGGYPIQVNSSYPSGNKSQADEPGPGTIQRTESSEGYARALNGLSPDGDPEDPENGNGGGSGGLPGLPGLGGALTGPTGFGAGVPAAAPDPSPAPGLPPALSALVDAGGFISASTTDNTKGLSTATSRAHVGDVKLLGGLVTIAGLTTRSSVISDGHQAKTDGKAHYGILEAFGQKFAFGPDGFEAMGQGQPIPGLPDNAVKALEQIGLKVSVPKPDYERDGDAATATVPGLVLDFDLTTLRSQLGPLSDALNQIVGQVPDQAGQLKSLLQAAVNLSPRIVYTLAISQSSVDTSPPIKIPDIPDVVTPPDDSQPTTDQQPQAATPPGSSSVTPGDTAPPVDTSAPPAGDGGLLLPTGSPRAPGLPKLYSLPGMLMLGGLLLAALGGSYLRRLGLLALGGGAACLHGLDSGLPDLRKVQ